MSTTYVLRVCDANLRSHDGFQWPGVGGAVMAHDWEPTAECGHGLHGWLHGVGDSDCATIASDSKWLVVEVEAESVIDLDAKVKFPRGIVRFVGSMHDATKFLCDIDPVARLAPVIGVSRSGGYDSTVSGGDGSTVSGGYSAQLLISYFDSSAERRRTAIAYVGEGSIKPNTQYFLDTNHHFVEVTP